MKPFSLEQWQQTADYVLSPMVAEQTVDESNQHYWKSVQQGLLAQHFPPGKWRDIYKAVSGLMLQSKPVHLTTLQAELNGHAPPDYLPQLYTLYQKGSTLSGGVFDANVDILKSFGERHALISKLHNSIDVLTKGGQEVTLDGVVGRTVSGLVNSSGESIENETAGAMAQEFTEYMSVMPDNNLNTGIRLIDNWIGGFARGDFLAIAAPMKQRKTSLALNILINMARAGHSVALMMLESNRRMVNAMIVSMLAIEWLMTQGHYDSPVRGGKARYIWAASLVKMRGRYRLWNDIRVQAVDYAIQELRSLGDNLRIYDRTREGGSLSDSASIHRVSLRDKALHDTDFIVVDHAQRITIPDKFSASDYEKLTVVVPYLEALARRENIAMCLLAQLKATESEGTGDTHLTGVRGGSILDEAVDYMLVTGYRQKEPDGTGQMRRLPNHVLKIGLQHSRYGDGGPHKRQYVAIDPNSGFLPYHGRPLAMVKHDDTAPVNVLAPDFGVNVSNFSEER